VDNIRVAKLVGGGLRNSTVVRGMVLRNDAVGSIKRMENAKVSSIYLGLLGWASTVYYIVHWLRFFATLSFFLYARRLQAT
jgi:hypothetical protein